MRTFTCDKCGKTLKDPTSIINTVSACACGGTLHLEAGIEPRLHCGKIPDCQAAVGGGCSCPCPTCRPIVRTQETWKIGPDEHCGKSGAGGACLGPTASGYMCSCPCRPCRNLMYPPEKVFDEVNRPKHYADRKFEPIDVIADNGWAEGFCLGNAYKYMARAGKKDGESYEKDMAKARWYLTWWATAVAEKKLDVPSLLKGPPEGEEAARG